MKEYSKLFENVELFDNSGIIRNVRKFTHPCVNLTIQSFKWKNQERDVFIAFFLWYSFDPLDIVEKINLFDSMILWIMDSEYEDYSNEQILWAHIAIYMIITIVLITY